MNREQRMADLWRLWELTLARLIREVESGELKASMVDCAVTFLKANNVVLTATQARTPQGTVTALRALQGGPLPFPVDDTKAGALEPLKAD